MPWNTSPLNRRCRRSNCKANVAINSALHSPVSIKKRRFGIANRGMISDAKIPMIVGIAAQYPEAKAAASGQHRNQHQQINTGAAAGLSATDIELVLLSKNFISVKKTKEVLDWKGIHLINFANSSCSQKLRIYLNLKNFQSLKFHILYTNLKSYKIP